MTEITRYLNLLNGTQYLRDNLDKLIEIFVSYYGEENREYIIDRFANTSFFVVNGPETISSLINKADKDITSDLIAELIEKIHIDFTEQELLAYSTLQYKEGTPIYQFKTMYELLKIGKEARNKEFFDAGYHFLKRFVKDLTEEQYRNLMDLDTFPKALEFLPDIIKDSVEYYLDINNADSSLKRMYKGCKDIVKKINPNIEFENLEEHIDDLSALHQIFEDTLIEYDNRMIPFDRYKEEISKFSTDKDRIIDIYHKKLIQENLDLIPESERETVDKYLNGEIDRYSIPKQTNFLFNTTFILSGKVEAFSDGAEETLNNPKESSWSKQSVKDDRIELFKMNGIDYGDDYEKYLNDPKVNMLIEKYRLINAKISEDRTRLTNDYNIDIYNSYDRHRAIRSEIEQIGLLDKNDSIDARMYTLKDNTFLSPNVRRTSDGYEMHNSLVLGIEDYDNGYIDHYLCHELNHLYEMVLLHIDDNGYSFNCGWDSGKGDYSPAGEINTLVDTSVKREYEFLNEIINELIAQDISKIMQEKGINIFDRKEKSKYRGATSYEASTFIVKDFFIKYKDIILKSRRNGNIQVLFDEIGQENFDELNKLVIDFQNKYQSTFAFMSLMKAYNDGEDSERTRYLKETLRKRDELLEKMQNNKSMRVTEESEQSFHM